MIYPTVPALPEIAIWHGSGKKLGRTGARRMLSVLKITNLAVVSRAELEFCPGYNVISGETGAGKSILIEGLMLVLGERADRALVRAGTDSCTVEAVFRVPSNARAVTRFLAERGIELDAGTDLCLRRVITATGASRQTINGSPVTVSVLAELGALLVDFHGPYEHQSLLKPAHQLALLDAYGELDELVNKFAELVRHRAGLLGQKRDLVVDERTYIQQLDYLRHQVREIEAARLTPGEDTQVEEAYSRTLHGARLAELAHALVRLLAEDETSVQTQLGQAGRLLREITSLDPGARTLTDLHAGLTEQLAELIRTARNYAESVEYDPAKLTELEQRLNLINTLKRKYGPGLDDVLAALASAKTRLAELESCQERLQALDRQLAAVESDLRKLGAELSAKRRAIAPEIVHKVTAELRQLGFKHCSFDIALEGTMPEALPEAVSESGFDKVEFAFSANPGEPARPLRAIASSGELARVMLALKTVLAAADQTPVLVFDEVDANIGGETGLAVGRKLSSVSRQHQVICITHLPQVAAFADRHFVVSKQVRAGHTEITVTVPDEAGRIEELARMLGGRSETATKHARTLLKMR